MTKADLKTLASSIIHTLTHYGNEMPEKEKQNYYKLWRKACDKETERKERMKVA